MLNGGAHPPDGVALKQPVIKGLKRAMRRGKP